MEQQNKILERIAAAQETKAEAAVNLTAEAVKHTAVLQNIFNVLNKQFT